MLLAFFYDRKAIDRAYAKAFFDKGGSSHRLDHLSKNLSGGEKQRMAIARNLGIDPQIFVADHSSVKLYFTNSQEVINIFKELNYQG